MKAHIAFIVCTSLSAGALANSVALKPGGRIYKGSATFVVKPARIQEFKSAVLKIIQPTRDESACIEYEAFQVVDGLGNPTNRFEFHELWKSKTAMMFDHKERAKHMIEFFKTLALGEPTSLVEKFEVQGNDVQVINSP